MTIEGDAPGAPAEPLHPLPAEPYPEGEGKGRSETVRRILTAAVLVPSVLFVIQAGGLWVLGVVLLIATVIILYVAGRLFKFDTALFGKG